MSFNSVNWQTDAVIKIQIVEGWWHKLVFLATAVMRLLV